ncbi:MAG: ABC transporter permease [Pseudomonadales bacterium]|nr:ABC transporter permease [Pseudomonadales bacterium]
MHFSLGLKLLWRDWRSGELTLLLFSLIMAVATVTTIALFVDRLQQALMQESATFLAADRVIRTAEPIAAHILLKSDQLGLQRAETISFLSMVFSAERAQFASIKAVNENYPLRGKLIVAAAAFERGDIVEQGPKTGEVWVESRLLPSLDIQVGDLLDIGATSLLVTKALIKEPDPGAGFDSAGPRVMMNLSDVPATSVVQPGSLINYRYLFAGDNSALLEFSAWVKPLLSQGSRVISVKDGVQGIGAALARAERFLLLGGLLGVVLAGVAIALSAKRYARRHFDHVAIFKTLGATPNAVDGLFLVIFSLLGLLATVAGSGLGYCAQLAVVSILGPYIPIELPAPGVQPFLLGLITGFVCLLSFALPPITRLRAIEPVRVIRRDVDEPELKDWLGYAMGVCGTLGLMWWYSQDLELALTLFSGAAVAVIFLYLIASLLLRTSRLVGMQAGSAWRLALAGMHRRGQENTVQILVFGLAIMLVLILAIVRTDLIDSWQSQIPDNAPNHFAINISPADVAPIRELLTENQIQSEPIYPMIRGRIIKVNQQSAKTRDANASTDTRRGSGPRSGATRNLTYATLLPDANEIVAGQWWPASYRGPALVSLEQEFALSNGLKIGDELVFNIQGREVSALVSNIRLLNWDNMRPNFYIIFSPDALAEFSSTFMTSFYLAADNKLFLNDILRTYPTMTVIAVDAIIEQIQNIIQQVSMAIELVLGLILVTGAFVLLASIQASMDERLQEHAILRTLGAARNLVMGSLIIEFCLLGLFAGLLATIGAEITVFALEVKIFKLAYTPNLLLWLLGPMLGLVLVGIIGTVATYKVVRVPPMIVLREI